MKKVLIILIFVVLITTLVVSTIYMFNEKEKLKTIDNDINNLITQKQELEEKNKNFEIEKEQVNNEINSNVNKDKLRMYEIWEYQNQYLDEALK